MATYDTGDETTLATINPADLAIHSNENAIMTVLDDNAWCDSVEDTQWQQAPIYVGSQTEAIPQQSTASIPAQNGAFDNLIWTGDFSFSSYASSPAENSLGMSRLAKQLQQQNLCVSPKEVFERPIIPRNLSSTPIPEEPAQNTPTRPSRRAKSGRGRLYADMSYDGPETVFEDSDSHHSWTAADNLEDWCSHLRERLLEFKRRPARISIITSHLQTRQRRKVHSMANLWGLSHMSLGSGREKRMLISKCELVKAPAGQKRWNPMRNNWSPGLVDPRIVLIDCISRNLSSDRLWECLRDSGLPIPQRLTIDHRSAETEVPSIAYAMYGDVDDAITALLALDGTRPNWNGIDATLEADFVQFPPGFVISESQLNAFHTLPDLLQTENQKQCKCHACRTKRNDNASGSDSEDELCTAAKVASRLLRHSKPVRDSGYLSYHSSDDSTSTYKKRKRVPKISSGYSCNECGKLFDRDGDRRKHEKNHNPERKHVCEECGKAFLFPKDLRRHVVIHGATFEPSSVESTGSELGTLPIPITPRRLHGRSRPENRRVSRLSSSFG